MRLRAKGLKTAILLILPASVLAQTPIATQTLPEVVVVGTSLSEYAVETAVSATRSEEPILDTPVSVQTVPRAVMDDQKARNLTEALKNVSSVQDTTVGSTGWDNPVVRGFPLNHQVWLDGMRLCCANFEIDNLEAVEVVKGPAGILYGRVEPGGLVNLVSKKPQAQTYRAINAAFGSWGFRKTSADLTGAFNQDNSLQYRLNSTYLDTRSFIEHDWNKRVFIAPSLRYRLSADTQFDLQYAYKHDRGSAIDGTQSRAINGKLVDLPYGLNLNTPDSTVDLADQLARLDGTHRVNDHWKIDARLMVSKAKNSLRKISPIFLMPDGRTVLRNASGKNVRQRTIGANVDITGTFDTMGLSHRLLSGIDYYQYHAVTTDYVYFSAPFSFVPSIDLYNPVQLPVNYAGIDASVNLLHGKANQQTAGIYLQDRIKVGDRWRWLLGGRYDMTRASMVALSAAPVTDDAEDRTRRSNRAFSPSLGALYKLRSDLSLYASYARSIALYDGSKSAAGKLFPPTRSVQYELGMKYAGPVSISIAGYELTKNNVPTPDPDPILAVQGFMVLTGQIRSRGIEIDLAGDVTRRWSVIGSLGWNDTVATQATAGYAGKRIPSVARGLAGLWNKIRLGKASGDWDVGVGLFAAGRTETSAGNNGVKLPGYAYVNAMTSRAWKENGRVFTLSLNIDNVFDRRYYVNGVSNDSGNGLVFLLPGAPRSARVTLQSMF